MKQELGTEASNEETVLGIVRTFYANDERPWTECVADFDSLLLQTHTGSLSLDLDFDKKEARYFIKADTLVALADLVGLHNHLTGKNVKNISVPLAMRVKNEFLQSVSYLKETYPWVYDPPSIPGVKKWSAGRDMRNDFQKDYGAYAELTYLIAHGEALKFDEVNSMSLSKYLALGEYLLRKRSVENIE